MSVPDHSGQLAQWRVGKHYEGTTKIGSGTYAHDAATFLHTQVDPNWHLLSKARRPGGNNWRGYAVDAIVYKRGPGQCQAVDLIGSSESKDANFDHWGPDPAPYYDPIDCVDPTTVAPFVLPPHHCALGCSLFWLLGAYRRWKVLGEADKQEKIDRNCDWFKTKTDGDVLRIMLAMYGKHPWQYIGSDIGWPDYEETLSGALDYVIGKFSLGFTPTLVGEGINVDTNEKKERLLQICARVFRPRLAHIPFAEIWNEHWATDGDKATVRQMAARLNQLLPELPLALDSPIAASGEGDLIAEVNEFYGGSVARVITPQWNRDEPNPRDLGPSAPKKRCSMEPRGPGATGPDTTDPLALSNDYIQSAIASQVHGAGGVDYDWHYLHSQPGAFGGMASFYTSANTYPDLWTVPNAEAIASAMKAVRNGRLPDVPSNPGGDVIPYDEAKSVEFGLACNDVYAESGAPKDAGMISVHSQRAAWDYYSGKLPWPESKQKHINELRAEYGLPPK